MGHVTNKNAFVAQDQNCKLSEREFGSSKMLEDTSHKHIRCSIVILCSKVDLNFFLFSLFLYSNELISYNEFKQQVPTFFNEMSHVFLTFYRPAKIALICCGGMRPERTDIIC